MGDPKKSRKKYTRPRILWNKALIESEKEIVREFGLTNKREIWKATAFVKGLTGDAKKLIPAVGKQSEVEKNRLLAKVKSYGLVDQNAQLAEILNIGLKDILERRIQTLVFKKGFSRTVKQARQFITHRHIKVNGKIITSPSYLVKENEKDSVLFIERSTLADENHAERRPIVKAPVEVKATPNKAEAKTDAPKTESVKPHTNTETKASDKKAEKKTEKKSEAKK